MGVQPYRVIFFQHITQVVGNTLWADDGGTGSYADYFHMGDGSKSLDNRFEHAVANHKGVSAGEQYVSNLRGTGDIVDSFLYSV